MSSKTTLSRRSALAGGALLPVLQNGASRPAILGGTPVRSAGFPEWPVIGPSEETAWMRVLRERRWFRFDGQYVRQFEEAWARYVAVPHAVAVANGTSALVTSLAALGVGPGDEVLVPPYTFIATPNAVLMRYALPVFVDTDIRTFQMDPTKVPRAITGRTVAVMPVHIGGSPADLEAIRRAVAPRSLPILEDACQAHGAELNGRKVGGLGDLGCFSFQASKNLNSGEGGAVTTTRRDLYERAFAFQNQGFIPSGAQVSGPVAGCNLRLTEFQGILLLEQLRRLEEQAVRRAANAEVLTSLLRQVPGIAPAELVPGTTRSAYHLYMFRFDSQAFAGMSRARFLQALRAEGIPASGGYSALNRQDFLKNTLASPPFKAIYGERRLRAWHAANQCPSNDRLCDEAVWLFQNMLLGPRSDMEQIAEAVARIQRYAAEVAK